MKKTTKVDIIAGFLGAGKTTLINKLLKEAYIGEKIAVLENEFGAIGLDGELIEGDGVAVTEMTNGCICCSLKTSLTTGLIEICQNYAPDHILLEPTGLADIGDIAVPVEAAAEQCDITLGVVITVINGLNFKELLLSGVPLVGNQLHHADLAIISRAEQCDKTAIIQEIHSIEPELTVIAAPWEKISGLTITELAKNAHHHGAIPCGCGCGHDHSHEHHHHTAEDFQYFCAETKRVFTEKDLDDLKTMLQTNKGGTVYRGKGVLKGDREGLRFDYVGGEFRLTPHLLNGVGKFIVIGKNIDEAFWQNALSL